MRIVKLYIALFVFTGLIAGCNDDPIFSGDDSNGGGSGSPTEFGNISLNSKIPTEIPLAGGPGTQDLRVRQRLFMGNSNATLVYTGYGADDSPFIDRIYRVDETTNTALDEVSVVTSRTWPVMSGDESTLIYEKVGELFVIDPATGVSRQIGASSTFSFEDITTTDDGSLVAFISDADLDGNNPGGFDQIFTLTTDGTDVFTQVSAFTADFFATVERQIEFSGDGNKLFFHSDDDVLGDGSNADGSSEVFSIDADGSNLTQLTDINSTIPFTRVSLHSDSAGENLAFTIEGDLYTYNQTADQTTFIESLVDTGNAEAVFRMHTISADGSRIFYSQIIPDGSGYELILYTNVPNGSNEEALFRTGSRTETSVGGASANPIVANLYSSSTGSYVSFLSRFDFGATENGDNSWQVYTYTR